MNQPLRLEYLDPGQLADHPANWKFHPPEQVKPLEAFIGEVGWAGALLYNERTGRLLDGHARKRIGLAKGEPVPVLIGSWPEEMEGKVLALLDPTGWGAIADKEKFAALMEGGPKIEGADFADLLAAVGKTATSFGDAPALTEREQEAEEITVPLDSIWPSDSEQEIPLLLEQLQADQIPHPVQTWGTIGHARHMPGTWHFYTADAKFTPLWRRPDRALKSGAQVLVEPNFSLTDQVPWPEALSRIYRKRWIARYWQAQGRRVLVDLNCDATFNRPHSAAGGAVPNLLGVPKGWNAYASRAHANQPEWLTEEWAVAQAHSGKADPLFLVVGGGKRVKELAREHGWVWVPEQLQQVHGGAA